MEKLIDIGCWPVANVLDTLLCDKSTKKNIIWATDSYEEYGAYFTDRSEIHAESLLWRKQSICPRIRKSQDAQAQRTRKKAEVFTPAWLCNRMNNALDEEWFGRTGVFNTENEDHSWTETDGRIPFPEGKTWQDYVDSRRLEITCGEAPYLVSRYDVSTGEPILPRKKRIGILDRKLRIINENTENREDWTKWAVRAFESSYGYEYQGDNVLIARMNLLLTFTEYYEERWERRPDPGLLRRVANVIAWNIWQMDGLKGTAPLGKPDDEYQQEIFLSGTSAASDEKAGSAGCCSQKDPSDSNAAKAEPVPCRIFDWRSRYTFKYRDVKEMLAMGKKLFDYVIGNPPYNEDFENSGDNGNFAKPVYNLFMDAAYEVADKVELIHPARFLFNAGSTPKDWNRKMLDDEHFKVLHYEANSTSVFQNTDIKGGIAITYWDAEKSFGAIKTFTAFSELNGIVSKAAASDENDSIASIVYTQVRFDLNSLYQDYPEYREMIGSNGKDKRFRNNIFDKLRLFTDTSTGAKDIKVLGISRNKRIWKYIPETYVDMSHENINQWKVLIPSANGSGALGEVLTTPLIGEPLIGYTQSFIGIGSFDTEAEAAAAMKYIKTKFARVILGVLKVTQHNDRPVWKLIPLQDFTPSSDIDWSKSIHEIDLQLYRKYGLDEKEIDFIETHVKEMA